MAPTLVAPVFESHVVMQTMAIERGMCEVNTGADHLRHAKEVRSSRHAGGRPPTYDAVRDALGFAIACGRLWMAAMRHMHEFGTTSVSNWPKWLWPHTRLGGTQPLPPQIPTVERFRCAGQPHDFGFLHLLDSCLVTDGGGAIVMTTAEHARALGAWPRPRPGFGEAYNNWSIANMPDLAAHTAAGGVPDAMRCAWLAWA